MPDSAAGGAPVILLPGAIMPAGLAYAALLAELGERVDAHAKDLEVYAEEVPPAHYGLDIEVEGVLAFANPLGFDVFHLVGYSAGGAVALAVVEAVPERVLSLALLEPAWAGNEGLAPEEVAVRQGLRQLARDDDPVRLMRAFVQLQLAPGVEPPPPPTDGPPPWMATRPAGIRAIAKSFDQGSLDATRLGRYARPVYYALGGRSNPDLYRQVADRLAATFPDFRIEVFAERHHLDPPHRMEPARLASALLALWAGADART